MVKVTKTIKYSIIYPEAQFILMFEEEQTWNQERYVYTQRGNILYVLFKKYKTFSVLIYSYINTSGNWRNEKLCGNTTPAGRSVFTQFRVFPIFTSVDITLYQYGKNVLHFFYNIAQRTLTEEWREIFRVDIELYQHGS